MRAQRGLNVRPWILLAVLTITAPIPGLLNAQGKACSLVTPEELQAALGVRVSLKSQSGPGSADLCTAQTPAFSLILRLAKRTTSQGAESAGLEKAKQMGATVDVRTDGPITCSTLIPPKNLEQVGYNTTCSVLKNEQVAAIEVTAKARKDMVSMDVLHKLVQQIARRF
jgi:hypothetical protein